MGTHAEPLTLWQRWRRWRRYRRNLAVLVRDWRKSGQPLTRDLVDEMREQARRAAKEGNGR
jgi:hypothetical protein